MNWYDEMFAAMSRYASDQLGREVEINDFDIFDNGREVYLYYEDEICTNVYIYKGSMRTLLRVIK